MIVIENEHLHGLFSYGIARVDAKVADYFVNGTMPERITSCSGKLLPADVASAAPSFEQPRQDRTRVGLSVYKDDAQSQDIIRRIHRKTHQTARRL